MSSDFSHSNLAQGLLHLEDPQLLSSTHVKCSVLQLAWTLTFVMHP